MKIRGVKQFDATMKSTHATGNYKYNFLFILVTFNFFLGIFEENQTLVNNFLNMIQKIQT